MGRWTRGRGQVGGCHSEAGTEISEGDWAVSYAHHITLLDPSIPSCLCGALLSLLTAQHRLLGFNHQSHKAIIPAHNAWLAQRLLDT